MPKFRAFGRWTGTLGHGRNSKPTRLNGGLVSFGERVSVDVLSAVLALARGPLASHLSDSWDLDVRPAFNSAFEFLHGDIQPMPGESGKLRRSVKVARRLGQK